MASNICWNNYFSRTYVKMRRMIIVSLYGVSGLFNIIPDYLDGVWILGMIQLILSNDTDSDDGDHNLIMRYHVCL
jgi:hypothetical protein